MQPDIRFNQLIDNLQYEFSEDNEHAYYHEAWAKNSEYTMSKRGYVDLFNLEDDVFIEWLKKRVKG